MDNIVVNVLGDKYDQDEDFKSEFKIGDKVKLTKYAAKKYASFKIPEVLTIVSLLASNDNGNVCFYMKEWGKSDFRRTVLTPIIKEQLFEIHLKKEQKIFDRQKQDDELRRNHNETLKKIQDDFNRPFAKRYALMACDLVGNPWNRD